MSHEPPTEFGMATALLIVAICGLVIVSLAILLRAAGV